MIKLELVFWGLGCQRDLEDHWETEVSNHREMFAVKVVNRIFKDDLRGRENLRGSTRGSLLLYPSNNVKMSGRLGKEGSSSWIEVDFSARWV